MKYFLVYKTAFFPKQLACTGRTIPRDDNARLWPAAGRAYWTSPCRRQMMIRRRQVAY